MHQTSQRTVRSTRTILAICRVLESKDGDGTVPAVAAGREPSGRRTTQQYLLHSRPPAHPTYHQSCEPVGDDDGREDWASNASAPRGKRFIVLIQYKAQESEGQQQSANR